MPGVGCWAAETGDDDDNSLFWQTEMGRGAGEALPANHLRAANCGGFKRGDLASRPALWWCFTGHVGDGRRGDYSQSFCHTSCKLKPAKGAVLALQKQLKMLFERK